MTDASAPPYNPAYPEVPPAFEYNEYQGSGKGYPNQGAPYPNQEAPYPNQRAPPGYSQYPPAYPGQGPHTGTGAAFSPPGPQQQTIVVQPLRFGEAPVSMNCPKCRASIITTTEYTTGGMTWLMCGIICGLGLVLGGITWLGCCLIPCCIDACQDVEHKCPNCKQLVGKLNRL